MATALLPSGINLNCLEDESDVESTASSTDGRFSPQLFCSNQDRDSPLTTLYHSLSAATYAQLPKFYRETQELEVPITPTFESSLEVEVPKPNCITPSKPAQPELDPLTPTANLKMLLSAASPEIRNREKLREASRKSAAEIVKEDDETDIVLVCDDQMETVVPENNNDSNCTSASQSPEPGIDLNTTTTGPSRKEKSLGLLCQRFLSRYPVFPPLGCPQEISLDEAAKDLGVERRRIYDIINVLESVEIVSRVAKNRYNWHGKTNLTYTLAKLRDLAINEGFVEIIEKVKEAELIRELKQEMSENFDCTPDAESFKPKDECHDKAQAIREGLRKDRSLGVMSQKFLMLFLVSKNKTINLELSAKILVGDPDSEAGNFKTKIRRLYDIANILTSLQLITKVQVTETRGRKPAFKYIGPCIDNVSADNSLCTDDGNHRPSSRHSLLDCVKNTNALPANLSGQNVKFCTIGVKGQKQGRPGLVRHASLIVDKNSKQSFKRHSSLDHICMAVEMALQEEGSNPAPGSDSLPVEKPFKNSSQPKRLVGLRTSPNASGDAKAPGKTPSGGALKTPQTTSTIRVPCPTGGLHKKRSPEGTKTTCLSVKNSDGSVTVKSSNGNTLYTFKPNAPSVAASQVKLSNAPNSKCLVSIVRSEDGVDAAGKAQTQMRIVRVQSEDALPANTAQASLNKRKAESDLPGDGSQCYFGAKKSRSGRSSPPPTEPIKARVAPRALNFNSSAPGSPIIPAGVDIVNSPRLQLQSPLNTVMWLHSPVSVQNQLKGIVSPMVTAVPLSQLTHTPGAFTSPAFSAVAMETPPSGVQGLRVLRSIQPTNAILNLNQQFASTNETTPRVQSLPGVMMATKASKKAIPPPFKLEPVQMKSSPTIRKQEVLLTPKDSILTAELLNTLLNNNSPLGTPILTPKSFFRGTPDGPTIKASPLSYIHSGFDQPLDLSKENCVPIDTATARRLQLRK